MIPTWQADSLTIDMRIRSCSGPVDLDGAAIEALLYLGGTTISGQVTITDAPAGLLSVFYPAGDLDIGQSGAIAGELQVRMTQDGETHTVASSAVAIGGSLYLGS